MDLDEFRLILSNTGVDLWTLIGTAISVASSDYRNELKNRRDGIVEQLYALPPTVAMSRNGDLNGDRVESPKLSNETKEKHSSSLDEVKGYSPYTPQSVAVSLDDDKDYHGGSKGREVKGCSPYTPQSVAVSLDDDKEHRGGSKGRVVIEDEQSKILRIKEHLEDPNQSNDSVVDLLRTLADMDITFKALQATDIGRHVNRLRKHSSGEVRRLVKQLVRKWKDLVDEWVECGGMHLF
ncbi:hypothetical protein GIB67_014565 [Kingdonia uniflora]|uniref:TFIIS N-terminal domain-containing protein n=1 Tax=Kingdonia uniflora TaxID=39325 RepID=A0A7J7LB40_9MAGN|nr:hypothetical protein GIB67_014565 [Kingdonia uniflora]